MDPEFENAKQPLAPAQVAMLQGLVSDYCLVSKVLPSSPDAETAAKQLLSWFQAGETDATRLRERLYSRDQGSA
jgi:hypothetical protein